jgi:hypothetical protein
MAAIICITLVKNASPLNLKVFSDSVAADLDRDFLTPYFVARGYCRDSCVLEDSCKFGVSFYQVVTWLQTYIQDGDQDQLLTRVAATFSEDGSTATCELQTTCKGRLKKGTAGKASEGRLKWKAAILTSVIELWPRRDKKLVSVRRFAF